MSSVFKGLNRSDVYLTDYNSRRVWNITGSNLAELDIKLMIALSSSRPYLPVDEDLRPYAPYTGTVGITSSYVSGTYNQRLAYGSVFELFYSGSQGDGTFSGPKDWSLPSSLTLTGSRAIPTGSYHEENTDSEELPDHQLYHDTPGFVVFAIPKEVFGTGITPGSFKVKFDEDVYSYVEDDYIFHETGSFCDEGYPLGVYTRESDHWVDPYFEDLHAPKMFDFEGLLFYGGFSGEWHQPEEYRYPTPRHETDKQVGDIVYAQGQAIVTDNFLRYLLSNWDVNSLQWESSKPVFTKHVICRVRDIDFNRTLNKSATEELQNTPGFTPYVTTVGLYNTEGELLAVAKLSKPIKKALDTETTFDIQIDLG